MATTQELKEYYSSLLILQYKNKVKANLTMEELAGLAIMDQVSLDVVDGFNLDTAIGAQLDVLGEYIGVTRNQFDFSGPVTLSDADFLTLLRIKIVQNSYTSDLSRIQSFLNTYFLNIINVFDYQDMTMSYMFQSAFGSQQLAEVFVKGGFLPRPMGVNLRTTIYAPTANFYYGFRTYDSIAYNVSPFNTYDSYLLTRPWLSYDDGISI